MKKREKGGTVAVVLGATVVAGLACVILLLYAGVYVAENVQVEATDSPERRVVSVKSPVGSFRLEDRPLDPQHLGVDVYPGARVMNDQRKGMSLELELGDSRKDVTVATAVYATSDAVENVREFYRNRLPHWIVTDKGMEYTAGGYKRFIGIHRHQHETRIVLASIGEPAAN